MKMPSTAVIKAWTQGEHLFSDASSCTKQECMHQPARTMCVKCIVYLQGEDSWKRYTQLEVLTVKEVE